MMLDYGTKVVAGVTPGKEGQHVGDIPVEGGAHHGDDLGMDRRFPSRKLDDFRVAFGLDEVIEDVLDL